MSEHPIPALDEFLRQKGAAFSVLAGQIRWLADEAADRASLLRRVGREWGLREDEVTQEHVEDWLEERRARLEEE